MKIFRTSKVDSMALNVAKTIIQICVFWSFFLGFLPSMILRAFPQRIQPLPELAVAMFAVAGAIGLYCGMTFAIRGGGTPLPLDSTTRFLVFGPYRYVRNPMALTGICQGVAVGIFLGSPAVVAYALAGILAWHFLARPMEEADLADRFGDAYLEYQQAVPLWIPRRTAYRPQLTDRPKL